MACSLKQSPTGDADFTGTAGANVTITIAGPTGVNVSIVDVRYAGTEISGPPYKFAVKSGLQFLVVLAEASQAGALLELREDCGDGTTNLLTTFHFDPRNPARGFFVKG